MRQLANDADPFKGTNARPSGFVGWWRGRGKWQRVCADASYKGCWEKLQAYVNPLTLNCERCVLAAHQRPDGNNSALRPKQQQSGA